MPYFRISFANPVVRHKHNYCVVSGKRTHRIGFDVTCLYILEIRFVDIVLRTNMYVAHSQERKLRYGIIPVCDTVISTSLVRDIIADLTATNSWRAIIIQSYGVASVAQCSCCQRGDRSAQRVTGDSDAVVRK